MMEDSAVNMRQLPIYNNMFSLLLINVIIPMLHRLIFHLFLFRHESTGIFHFSPDGHTWKTTLRVFHVCTRSLEIDPVGVALDRIVLDDICSMSYGDHCETQPLEVITF